MTALCLISTYFYWNLFFPSQVMCWEKHTPVWSCFHEMMTNKWASLSPSVLSCASLLNMPLSDGEGGIYEHKMHANVIFEEYIAACEKGVFPHHFEGGVTSLWSFFLYPTTAASWGWLPFLKWNHLEGCNDVAALLTCWKRHVYTTTSWTYSKTESTGTTLIIGTHFWDWSSTTPF